MWAEVLARFEKKTPASVMAKLILEQAVPAEWVDQVFEEHRQRQYPRELLFSTIVELMSLVPLGLRPSLHAAARQMDDLPVTLAALYDKVSRTEPALLRALVTGSAERLTPTIEALGCPAILPGWQLRIVDGNHLPSTEKRLGALRRERGAARPGFSVVVYDPDLDQIVDLQPCEDAYASERVSVLPLLARATKGQLWMADRLYCTLPVMQAREETQASLTPLHRDDSDNLFAQVWGEKSMLLAAPHHRIALGSWSTSPHGGLEGCDFDPSNPNFEEFPAAKHVSFFAVHLKPGDLLFLPEGWFHQVRSLTSSLSINFWVNSVREKIDSN